MWFKGISLFVTGLFVSFGTFIVIVSCTSGVDIGGTTVYELMILNDGDGSTSPAGIIEANHGVAINITATPDSIFGYNNQFDGWTVISGSVTFGNSNEASTTVTLSNGDATIQANFDQNQIGISTLSIVPDNKKLTISWNPIPDTQSYTLYFTTDTLVPETSGTGTSVPGVDSPYELNVSENDVLYTVQVRASSSGGEHVWTDFERAIPLTKTALVPNTFGLYRAVYLEWPALTSTSNYQVMRSTSKDGTYTAISGMIGTNSYTDNSVSLYQTYYYKIKPAYADTIADHESYAKYAEPTPFGIVQHGRLGGGFWYDSAIASQGTTVYLSYEDGIGPGLKIFNASNPNQPSQLGSCSTTEHANDIALSILGDYAYLASDDTFMVVSISNPLQPSEVGTCTVTGDVTDIAVSGNYAILTTYNEGLKVIDIETKTAPDLIETASCDTGGTTYGIAIEGTYAYVADAGLDTAGLKVVDISSPSTLSDSSVQRSCLFFGGGLNVEIADDGGGNTYAYVIDNVSPGNFLVIDITNPLTVSDSSIVGTCDIGGSLEGLTISGNNAIVIGDDLAVVDIHDPDNVTNESLVGRSDNDFDAISSGDDYFYAIGWYSGSYYLHVVYCLVPSHPSVLRTHDTVSYTYKVAIDGDYAYVADGEGLKVFSISDPDSSSEVGSCSFTGGLRSVAVHGPHAFVGGENAEFSVVDISDPPNVDNDSILSSGSISIYVAWDIKVRGDLVFVADNQDGIVIIDISDPANPLEIPGALYSYDCLDIALLGDYAYIARGFDGGMTVLNIEDRGSQDQLILNTEGVYPEPPTTIWTNGVAVKDTNAYITVGYEGLRILDLSSGFSSINEQGALSTSDPQGNPQGVDVQGEYVFIANSDESPTDNTSGLKVIQVSDSVNPLLASSVKTLNAWDVVVNGTYAYLVDGDWTAENNKFRIIDLLPDD
jgi:hypothetical protein